MGDSLSLADVSVFADLGAVVSGLYEGVPPDLLDDLQRLRNITVRFRFECVSDVGDGDEEAAGRVWLLLLLLLFLNCDVVTYVVY